MVPRRAQPREAAYDGVVAPVMARPSLVLAVVPSGLAAARHHAMGWGYRVADPQPHIGADHGFALAREEPPFARRKAAPSSGERSRRADHWISAHRIAEGNRRCRPCTPVTGERIEDGTVDQRERRRLQAHGREHELPVP